MKRFLSLLIALLLAVMSLVPMMSGAFADYVSSANGKGVNLRVRAAKDARLIEQLGEATSVKVVRRGTTWSKVSVTINGRKVTGYCMTQFLSKKSPARLKQTFTKVTPFKVTVTPTAGASGYVHMRAKADTGSATVVKLYKGDKLTVLAESRAWYKVRDAKNHVGYVVKAYVKK